MAANDQRFFEPSSAAEAELAAAGCRALAKLKSVPATIRITGDNGEIELPAKAVEILACILGQMAIGSAISIVPIHKELTTQEAAELLNVSRPYLIKQVLDKGKIPFHQAGNRRKIYSKDLLAYKKRQGEETDRIMIELASLSQSLGIMG